MAEFYKKYTGVAQNFTRNTFPDSLRIPVARLGFQLDSALLKVIPTRDKLHDFYYNYKSFFDHKLYTLMLRAVSLMEKDGFVGYKQIATSPTELTQDSTSTLTTATSLYCHPNKVKRKIEALGNIVEKLRNFNRS